MYGGLELLLFGVSRIVLNIDFEARPPMFTSSRCFLSFSLHPQKGTFEWVDHATILRELNMNQDQFIDSCILAGFDLCLTFPPLLDALFSFRGVRSLALHRTGLDAPGMRWPFTDLLWLAPTAAYEMVKAYGSGRIAVETHSNHPQVQNSNYIELYIRTKYTYNHYSAHFDC